MGARKCNINRYLIWVSKSLLWITWQQYWWSQDLPSALVLMDSVFSKLESFKFPCYLPISCNYHLDNLWRLSGLICKFVLFNVTGCLFPRKSRKSRLHCNCMDLFFHQYVHSYPFNNLLLINYSVLNGNYKERTLWTCYDWIGTFSHAFIVPFSERLLSIPIRTRLLFLDMAMIQYFTKIV